MIKKVIVLGLIAVSLTGCIVAPYDDHPNRHDRDHPRWDNDHRNGDHDRPRYPNRGDNRPDWNDRR